MPRIAIIKNYYKLTFTAMDLHHHDESVANDTIYSDITAIGDGSKYSQLFVGKNSPVLNIYGMQTNNQVFYISEDNIRA